MTREEELITRWIDGELGTEEEIEFNKLYKLNPDYYDALIEDSKLSQELLRSTFDAEKEVPYGDFFNHQIRKKIHEDNSNASSSTGVLFDMLTWLRSPFTWAAAVCFIALIVIGPQSGVNTENNSIVSTYSPDPSVSIVSAEFNEQANATVIVLEGLEPVPDETDFNDNHITSYDREGPPGFVQFYNNNDKLVYILETDEYGQPNIFQSLVEDLIIIR